VTARHAAALALVGWYLMLPPFKPDKTPDPTKPLAQWDIFKGFDSAADCETFRESPNFKTESCWFASDPKTGDFVPWNGKDINFGPRLRICDGRCVSTDDPRLKGK
jgi:hypothetical protein